MAKASRVCALVALRLLAFVASATATIVMATSHQTATFYNFTIEAKFQDTPAFKFFVIANAIVAAYTFVVLFVPRSCSFSTFAVYSDAVMTMLLTAAISAAGAIGEIGKKGNRHAGWLPICKQFHKFCDQVSGSIICGFIAVLVYLIILIHSIHKSQTIL